MAKPLLTNDEFTLQDVLKRSDVALVTEDVSTREELLDCLMRYLKLPRADRRLSDYYSVKLFGFNVSDMFINMSYRFKFEPLFPINETLFISEPDLYYNKKAFDKGTVNLCFVIGYSGSGKSHLTKEYEGDNIERVSLDDIVCIKDHYTLDELQKSGELLYSFFSGEGKKYYISREERNIFADRSEVFVKFIKYAWKYSASHKDKKFILEGIWTYLFFDDPSEFDKYAVFMKGTSLIKSKFRRMKRESTNDLTESWDRLLDFGIYAADTTLRDGNVDKWRRYFEKKTKTVIKPEDNAFTILRAEIMNEFFNINDCFVHGDVDGIKAIMERVSDDNEIDITEKAIVTEECRRAIADIV